MSGSGRMLGVLVGPAADNAQWDQPITKMLVRARALAGIEGAMSTALTLFPSRVTAVLNHVLQFAPVSSELRVAIARAIAIAFRTPMNAIPTALLARLDILGLHPNVPLIDDLADAIVIRTIYASAVLEEARADLSNALGDDNALFHPPAAWWPLNGVIGHFRRVQERVDQRLHPPPLPGPHLQRRVMKALAQRTSAQDIARALRVRLHGVVANRASDDAASINYLTNSFSAIRPLCSALPPSVLCSWVRTVANCWATSHRFSGVANPCLWGCGLVGGDRISHLLCCDALFSQWTEACPGASLRCSVPIDQPIFPSLCGDFRENLLLIDAAYSAYVALSRPGRGQSGGNVSLAARFTARLRAQLVTRPSLRRYVVSLSLRS